VPCRRRRQEWGTSGCFRRAAPTWTGADPNSQARQIQIPDRVWLNANRPSGTDMKRVAEQWHRYEARGRCSYDRVLPKSVPGTSSYYYYKAHRRQLLPTHTNPMAGATGAPAGPVAKKRPEWRRRMCLF
jgi:hypothetical protein